MSTHLYEMSSKLIGDTVGRVHDNLTTVVLAASFITLSLGYMSKLLLSQSCVKDAVSSCKTPQNRVHIIAIRAFTLIVPAEISTIYTLLRPLSGPCHFIWEKSH